MKIKVTMELPLNRLGFSWFTMVVNLILDLKAESGKLLQFHLRLRVVIFTEILPGMRQSSE